MRPDERTLLSFFVIALFVRKTGGYFSARRPRAVEDQRLRRLTDHATNQGGQCPSAMRPSCQIGFPFNIRRSLGIWKRLFVTNDWVITGDLTPEQTRGRYIAEALAHCGECHTPRNALGGLQRDNWLSGAATPDGKGKTPNITPGKLAWSEAEIVEYLTSGFTPAYDSVGGHMAHVVDNMARLPEADRKAVAAYLKLVPAIPAP